MVHFVGAGPGAVDLITVRGLQLLKEADQVIYAGSLVNPELLQACREDCRILNSASMTLEEIVSAIEAAEAEGLDTVRLHTGDPSVFGAIGEQMDRLDALGIAYDVIPGVSSFCAAAAALPAEYTVPGRSQTVILTRMPGRTPVPEGERMADLARHRASMAVFLSAGLLRELTEELLTAGWPEDAPAAIVYKASWPDEKVLRCSIAELADAAGREGIRSTALVLLGEFLSDRRARSLLYDPEFTHGYRSGGERS